VARLHAEGHAVTGLGRDVSVARRRLAYADWITKDLRRMTHSGDWTESLAGVDAVVNCAGALQDNPSDDLAAVHVHAAKALYEACMTYGVRRVVLISAAGVDAKGTTRFSTTKQAGEAELGNSDLDWVILRPGLVLAPMAYGGSALLRALAALPLVIPLPPTDSVLQVVSVDDVTEAVVRAIAPNAPAKINLDLVSAEKTSLKAILTALRAWLGFAPVPAVTVPIALVAIVGKVSDALALLGWRSPMRTTSVRQLAAGVEGDPAPAREILGLSTKSLADILAAWPAGVQEHWFARLYILKPIMLGGLAAFWASSGLIGLTYGFQPAINVLAGSMPDSLAAAFVVMGGVIDVLLAVGVCVQRFSRTALLGIIAVSAAYLVCATIWRPDLWSDPLGPLVKVIPAALLALVALATMGDR